MRILVTGASGFIAGYVIRDLLAAGWDVTGLDDESKYGHIARAYDNHPRYRLVVGDAADPDLVTRLIEGCDHFIAGAAKIGGIGYFHKYPYDLLAVNERITAAAGDAALYGWKSGYLRKATWISSSMVYESAKLRELPSAEGSELRIAPPGSSYGFQKLATEYFARALHEQYNVPYTILRPFNCVGTGELPAHSRDEGQMGDGNLKLGLAHVVPELALKVVAGQDPLHLLGDGTQVRHYTYGGDLARGIVTSLNHPAAYNEDFNLASADSTTVIGIARLIWHMVKPSEPFRWVSDPPYEHDVQSRIPSVDKAARLLGFRAPTSLEEMVGTVVRWVQQATPAARV